MSLRKPRPPFSDQSAEGVWQTIEEIAFGRTQTVLNGEGLVV